MNIHLEYKDDKSAKFWKISVEGTSHTVTYGKIGTDGQSKTKTFETAEKASKDAEKLIKTKTKKGYQEIGTKKEAPNDKIENVSIDITFIAEEEARERFDLDQYEPLGEIEYDTVLLLEGNIVIDATIDDDSIDSIFFNDKRETEEELIVINGNLTIKGNLEIFESNPCLLVLGDLHCEVLNSNDNIIHVTGDAHIKYVYNGNYNHGSITVEGTTFVPYLLNSNHYSDLNPAPKTILINYYNNHDDFFAYDYYSEDIPYVFIQGLAKKGVLDMEQFIARVKTGKSPFKKGMKPSRILLENEIKQLAKKATLGEGIKELDLMEKKLRKLPPAIFELESLEVLNLSKNNFSVLPDEIGQLVHLKELNLVNTNIKSLPEAIGQLQKLEILNLYNCRNLERLPASIGLLKNLKVLNLNYCNTLECLPEAIGELSNLKKMILDNTKVLVPSSITKLTNLEQLNFTNIYGRGTKPTDFPSWICELKGLKILNTGGNKFRNLPDALSKLSKLEYWSLSYSLSALEEIGDLSKLESLKELRLTGGAVEYPYASQDILQHFFKIKSLETLGITDFGEVKLPVNPIWVEKERETLKDNPEKLAKFESRLLRKDGYYGSQKKISIHKYKDDPVKLEEDRKRISVSNAKYTYIARLNITKEAFKGLDQLVNLKELDIRGVILESAPVEIAQLKQLARVRSYSNVFPKEAINKLEALGIEVVR